MRNRGVDRSGDSRQLSSPGRYEGPADVRRRRCWNPDGFVQLYAAERSSASRGQDTLGSRHRRPRCPIQASLARLHRLHRQRDADEHPAGNVLRLRAGLPARRAGFESCVQDDVRPDVRSRVPAVAAVVLPEVGREVGLDCGDVVLDCALCALCTRRA